MKRDNTLWKALLEDIFADFLTFFYPDANELFELERPFEYLDKELEQLFPPEDDSFAPRFVDKLVKVFCKTGEEQWILVHIEVQGYNDSHFAERMFTYYYRIFDKYHKPITAFAIFTDRNYDFQPQKYEKSFLGTRIIYEFNTYKILDQSESKLLQTDNPFALVILTVLAVLKRKRMKEGELLELKIELAKRLLNKNIPRDKVRSLMNFLKFYIRFENKQTSVKFDNALDAITLKTKTMGLEEFLLDRAEKEGIEIGESKKSTDFTKSLLSKTELSIEVIADLVGVSVTFVEKVKAGQIK